MIDLPKTEWLRSFVAFASTRSFTQAAEQLHLSQPALHAQVARLTELVGLPLYRRDGRQLELTDAGRALATTAREVLARLEAELEAIRGSETTRPTTLLAGEGALLYVLGTVLARFRDHGHALRLATGDRAAALEAVRQARCDVAVTVLEAPPDDLESVLVAEGGHRLVQREDAPNDGPLDVAALAKLPLVAPPPGSPLRVHLERAAAAGGRSLEVAVEARGWPVTLQTVALGLGVAVVNDLVALPDGLVGRPIEGLPKVRYFGLRRRDGFVAEGPRELWRLLATARAGRR